MINIKNSKNEVQCIVLDGFLFEENNNKQDQEKFQFDTMTGKSCVSRLRMRSSPGLENETCAHHTYDQRSNLSATREGQASG